MNTFEISETTLDGYVNNKLGETRINFLITQANEQIDEISQNKELYDSFLDEVEAPQKVDKIILWILLMSNEDISADYSRKFDKGFRDIIPVSDLSDLVFHVVYSKKVKNIELDGFDYLAEYKEEGIEEVDQYSFTNAFLYVQELKEVKMEF